VCEPIANKPLKEISFGQVLISLFEAAQRFDAQMQPQLMLIQKTLLQIEGVGRQLYPDLDLWKTAQPLLREWVAERWSIRSIARDLKGQLPDLVQALRRLPPLFENTVQKAADGRLTIPVRTDEVELLRAEIREHARRRDRSLISLFSAFAGVLWIGFSPHPAWPGIVLLVGGAISWWSSRD
jgi:ubiquinone biosynthesis protein